MKLPPMATSTLIGAVRRALDAGIDCSHRRDASVAPPGGGLFVHLALLCVFLVLASAQKEVETIVAGAVFDGNTGFPVAGAYLRFVSQERSLTTESGATGRFRFSFAGAARGARVEAVRPGYLPAYWRQLGPHDELGPALRTDFRAGEAAADLRVRLWPESVIQGLVTDQDREPIPGASVFVLSSRYTGSGTRWLRSAGPVTTDERGFYRFKGLAPGRYLVQARPSGFGTADDRIGVPAYHPAAVTANEAVPVVVSGGTYAANVTLGGTAHAMTVSGEFSGADRSLADMKVHLIPLGSVDPRCEHDDLVATTSEDNRFVFRKVLPGRYRLIARQFPPSNMGVFSVAGDFRGTMSGFTGPRAPVDLVLPVLPDRPTWVAELEVTVDRDAQHVIVPMKPGPRISGAVIFEGVSQRPSKDDMPKIPVVIRPADGGTWGPDVQPEPFPQGRLEQDARFRSPGLPPDDYVLNVSKWSPAIGPWTVRSVLIGGREHIGKRIALGSQDVSVSIIMTDRITEVTGTVRDSRGHPTGEARVILFPRSPADWGDFHAPPAGRRILQVRVDGGGGFRATIQPGEYFAATIASEMPEAWMAPESLRRLSGSAVPFDATLGESKNIALVTR